MKVKRLKEILNNLDDNLEIFIRNSVNVVGNIGELQQVEQSTYGSFGEDVPCLILNTYHSKREEFDELEDINDFVLED